MPRENVITIALGNVARLPFLIQARRPFLRPKKILILKPCCVSQVLLATPLLNLRSMRSWSDEEDKFVSFDESIEMERAYLTQMIDAVASRDPEYARTTIRGLMKLPVAAEMAMRVTAVGEIPIIPLPLSRWDSRNSQE